jgi:uncharacterized protein YpmB
MWGIKTFYYSLINKQGSKAKDEVVQLAQQYVELDTDDDCEACKL